jgi:glycosyltransferase involved in cell wall biosynthesis
MTAGIAFDRSGGRPADICLVAEGCYPHVAGGVSSWLDWLMRSLPEVRFALVAIVSGSEERTPRYAFPDNLLRLDEIALHAGAERAAARSRSALDPDALAAHLSAFLRNGALGDLRPIMSALAGRRPGDLLSSETGWSILVKAYGELMPYASFAHFYWAWRSLVGGLLAVLAAPLPEARAYHAVSTGYAGLLAARAAIEGRPALLTEHGIYTNERRIEILMADWIVDTIDAGLTLEDPRDDLRNLWAMAFESYARACYEACERITTLYRDNQDLQIVLGARRERLQVIPNGIDLARFAQLARPEATARPTMALIGRVVPIKDVKTFIAAASRARAQVPDLLALVLGPEDEDAAYAAQCAALAEELGLEDVLRFLGRVDVRDWLPRIDVVVLTSLSEAQPLSLLEAGAAGIPCVATDVGSCREILEGAPDEEPRIGPGGFVAPLGAPDEIADRCAALLSDPDLRRGMGARLRRRVRRLYGSDRARDAYRGLYEPYLRDGEG